jgi:hypothetical protein
MREFSADELAAMFWPILSAVRHELTGALWKFPSFNSPHEGWAVIREELDELWEHVKANEGHTAEAQQEALQIAAMACRYVLDLTNEEAL